MSVRELRDLAKERKIAGWGNALKDGGKEMRSRFRVGFRATDAKLVKRTN
jgi:hypothetical protein